MKKRDFQKELNRLINNNIVYSGPFIEMIENDKKVLFGDEPAIALIKENLPLIFERVLNGYEAMTLKEFYKYDELKQSVKDLLINVLVKSSSTTFEEIIMNCNFDFDISDYINSNFDKLLENKDLYKWFLSNKTVKISDENLEKLNAYLENNKDIVFESLIKIGNNNIERTNYEDVKEIAIKLIDELCESEKVKYIDIREIGSGAYSKVCSVGSKVIKIGAIRQTYEMPNNKRILQPLIRVDLSKISDVQLTIEVEDKVDTNVHLSADELYNLYKELREQGIICGDLRNANLGYLLKDNLPEWGKPISQDMQSRGYDSNNEEYLKRGDLVIIDTDFIYRADDPNVSYGQGYCKDYEERYQREKANMKKDLVQLREELLSSKEEQIDEIKNK